MEASFPPAAKPKQGAMVQDYRFAGRRRPRSTAQRIGPNPSQH
jgi:hypothetical protein